VKRVTALSGVRLKERPFKGQIVPCDADDNTLILLDFGENVFGLAYGTVAGTITHGFEGTYFGTKGTIVGLTMNGKPLAYPGSDKAYSDTDGYSNYRLLPHVLGPHLSIEEMHVYEDIMQLVDWIREGIPSIVTAEHARHVIEIIEAAYRASETGQIQKLTTTF
jgi:predicted dehydrogenase